MVLGLSMTNVRGDDSPSAANALDTIATITTATNNTVQAIQSGEIKQNTEAFKKDLKEEKSLEGKIKVAAEHAEGAIGKAVERST